jgi:hypothetical protein
MIIARHPFYKELTGVARLTPAPAPTFFFMIVLVNHLHEYIAYLALDTLLVLSWNQDKTPSLF